MMIPLGLARALREAFAGEPARLGYLRGIVEQIDPVKPVDASIQHGIMFTPRQIAIILDAIGDPVGVEYVKKEQQLAHSARSSVNKPDNTLTDLQKRLELDETALIELDRMLDQRFDAGIARIIGAIRAEYPFLDSTYGHRVAAALAKQERGEIVGVVIHDSTPVDRTGWLSDERAPISHETILSPQEWQAFVPPPERTERADSHYRDSDGIPIRVGDEISFPIDAVTHTAKVVAREVRNYFGCLRIEGIGLAPQWVRANKTTFIPPHPAP